MKGAKIADMTRKERLQIQLDVLQQARDRLSGLESDPSNFRVELRGAFRGGYAQCRTNTRDALNDMIVELGAQLSAK